MTATLGELAAAAPVLARLAALRLPAKATYALAKLVVAVDAETALFHTQRNEAIQAFGTERDATLEERAENGGQARVYQVDPERVPAFVARVQEFAELPIDLPDRLRLPLVLLDTIELSAHEFLALRPLVLEPTDDQS